MSGDGWIILGAVCIALGGMGLAVSQVLLKRWIRQHFPDL